MKMSFSNTFGSNLSFKADVLKAMVGSRSEMGVRGYIARRGDGIVRANEGEVWTWCCL